MGDGAGTNCSGTARLAPSAERGSRALKPHPALRAVDAGSPDGGARTAQPPHPRKRGETGPRELRPIQHDHQGIIWAKRGQDCGQQHPPRGVQVTACLGEEAIGRTPVQPIPPEAAQDPGEGVAAQRLDIAQA